LQVTFLAIPYSDSVDLYGSAAEGYADHDACGAAAASAPPPPPPTQSWKVKPQVHLMQNNQLVAPKVIPKETKIIKEEAEPDPNTMGMPGGVPGGVAGGSMAGVLGGVIGGAAGPPPPKPAAVRIRQGGAVLTAASLINKVNPVYPPPRADRRALLGLFRLHAIISKKARSHLCSPAIHYSYSLRWTPSASGIRHSRRVTHREFDPICGRRPGRLYE